MNTKKQNEVQCELNLDIESEKDIRKGLPSASSMARIASCPASFKMEQCLPNKNNNDSNSGTRIHSYLSGDTIELTEDEMQTAVSCLSILDKIVKENSYSLFMNEKRLWFNDLLGNKQFSGSPDVVFRNGKEFLIIDYKTGRMEYEKTESHHQLLTLSVLLANHLRSEHIDFDTIRCCIIQPWVTHSPKIVSYSKDDINKAELYLLEVLSSAHDENAPANPNEVNCKYCKALSICPHVLKNVEKSIKKDNIILDKMNDDEILSLYNDAKLCEKWTASILNDIKTHLQNGKDIKGLYLKNGSRKQTVTDIKAIKEAVQDKIDSDSFLDFCNLSIPKLQKEYIKKSTGLKRIPKEIREGLEEQFSELTSPFIEVSFNSPSIEKLSLDETQNQ